MKRAFAFLFACIFSVLCFLPTVSASVYNPDTIYSVKASSVYIVNTDTNIIVYEQEPAKQVPAGGLTKLMTIALLLTNYGDQLDTRTFQMPYAISDYVHGTDNADMRTNETFTLREAMIAMLLRNANDAAMGMAYQLTNGDLTSWVSQMNSLSRRIGTTDSTWTDACGLSAGNVTTAVDMYLILRYLMQFDAFVQAAALPSFSMPAKERHSSPSILVNHNVALNKVNGGRFYRSSMKGGMCDVLAYKNDHGPQSYVSWASQHGETYIFCVMDSPDSCDDYGYTNRRPALYETTHLMDWVFDSFIIQPALATDVAIAQVNVKYSSASSVLVLYPDDSMMTILPSSSDGSATQKFFHLPDHVYAPIHKGDVIGSVELKLAGETIGSVNLLAGQDIERSPLLYGIAQFQDFLGSLYLRVVLILSLLSLGGYALWSLYLNLNGAARRRYHGRKRHK